MKNFRERCICILCKLGKYGVGKSLVWGMYDIPIPEELRENREKDEIAMQTVDMKK